MNPAASERPTWLAAVPTVFVLLWSTGFIGAKLGLPYAEPFTFLAIRMVIATMLLLLFAWLTRAPWPRKWSEAAHIAVAGLLVHAIYLGGVFTAIHSGLSAGITALIVGTQPLLTAAVAGWFLGEQVIARQWVGLVLGLMGIGLVVSDKLTGGEFSVLGMGSVLLALLGITLGTLYQKRFCAPMDLRSGGVIQYAASGVVLLILAVFFESMQVIWSGEFIFALTWLVVVLSVGAVGLLYTLIHYGAVAKVASLFYLTPPLTALLAYWLFGETLGMVALIGMVVTVVGVALVNVPIHRRIKGYLKF